LSETRGLLESMAVERNTWNQELISLKKLDTKNNVPITILPAAAPLLTKCLTAESVLTLVLVPPYTLAWLSANVSQDPA
jgi:hypothetical protein